MVAPCARWIAHFYELSVFDHRFSFRVRESAGRVESAMGIFSAATRRFYHQPV
jgi:hypothetical protein